MFWCLKETLCPLVCKGSFTLCLAFVDVGKRNWFERIKRQLLPRFLKVKNQATSGQRQHKASWLVEKHSRFPKVFLSTRVVLAKSGVAISHLGPVPRAPFQDTAKRPVLWKMVYF